jgi:2',3'-cyclic-nucleotide 2'-phosphodiesterase (5'-nucleotidase family)
MKWVAVYLIVWGASAGAFSLTILYTNDLHVRLTRLECLGRLIEEERASADAVLLLDAGDAWQDFRVPLYAVWGAHEMVLWMNQMGYDAMALGNHDLYWGEDRLEELTATADFPLLCANLHMTSGITPSFTPYIVRRLAGLDILIIGLITEEYLPYPDYPWLRYVEPKRAIATVWQEVGSDFDLIIAVGHLSIARARQIADVHPAIDLFLTGHSHEMTPEPAMAGKTRIVQAGEFGQYLGRLRLEFDPESKCILAAENTLLPTEKTPVRIGRGLLKLVETILLIIGSLLVFL